MTQARTLTIGTAPNVSALPGLTPFNVSMGMLDGADMEKKKARSKNARSSGKGCRFIKGGACLCHTSKGTRFSKKSRCR